MLDPYCGISGVSTFGGPRSFLEYKEDCQDEFEGLLSGILSKLLASENASLGVPGEYELREILTELLTSCTKDYEDTDSNPIPKSMQTWNCEVVVISPVGGELPDDNNSVQLRVCSEYSGYGWYEKIFSDGEWKEESTRFSYIGPEPAVFMDLRCWSYLKSWITLPPHPLAVDSETLFYTEFWDLMKGDFKYGNYPSTKLDYTPLQFTVGDHQEPPIRGKAGLKHALEKMCLDNVPHLRHAICSGIRGTNLGTALLDDFQLWAFESPDIWPCWSEDVQKPVFTSFTTTSTHPLLSLPFELLIEIFADSSFYDVLNMATTCKSLRQFFFHEDVFSALLRAMVRRGSLRWLNPCPSVLNEVARANQSLATWIHNKERGAVTNPFQVDEFPFLAFVHVCFVHSFSMRSRRRLWEIIKQVERRWVAVRNGRQLGGEDDPDKWALLYDI
ncbi:hypothetical protein DL96DRAFT_1288442 [Flagelloscypha sp. PMI_526]|nr:hypothetical protein DL96DRAFT_1288442 [Flagelloscypha sp. PMI_526]